MLGSATLTIDASRTTTNCATQSRISAVQRRSTYFRAVVITSLLSIRTRRLCGRLRPYDERETRRGTVDAPCGDPLVRWASTIKWNLNSDSKLYYIPELRFRLRDRHP